MAQYRLYPKHYEQIPTFTNLFPIEQNWFQFPNIFKALLGQQPTLPQRDLAAKALSLDREQDPDWVLLTLPDSWPRHLQERVLKHLRHAAHRAAAHAISQNTQRQADKTSFP